MNKNYYSSKLKMTKSGQSSYLLVDKRWSNPTSAEVESELFTVTSVDRDALGV